MMGKAANSVQTGTKVPEQLINKLLSNSSIIAKLESYTDHAMIDSLTNLGLIKEKEQKINLHFSKKNIFGFQNLEKIKIGRYTICSESMSSSKKCNDHFVRLKTGEFIVITFMKNEEEIYGFVIKHQPYFLKPGVAFDYIFNGTINRSNTITFKVEDIAEPFSTIKTSPETCLMFILFNRHN